MNTVIYKISGEFSEKLVAAITLKNLPANETLISGIKASVKDIEFQLVNGLAHQDLFFKEVTKTYKLFQELSDLCEDAAHSDLDPANVAQQISDTNEIFLVCFI